MRIKKETLEKLSLIFEILLKITGIAVAILGALFIVGKM